MIDMNSLEQHILRSLIFYESDISKSLDLFYFKRRSANISGIAGGIGGYFIDRANYSYQTEGNIEIFKQNFYTAGQLFLYAIHARSDLTPTSYIPFICALLSDNKDLIHEIATIESGHLRAARVDPLVLAYPIRMLQAAILEQEADLQHMIHRLAKNGRKPARTAAAKGEDFYSLLLKRDKRDLELLIHKNANMKCDDPYFEGFLAPFAILQAKLCWRRGIEVQIDHPLVPMDMLPIKPLERYETVYDFLEPGWKPPRQGWLGRLEYRLKHGKRTYFYPPRD